MNHDTNARNDPDLSLAAAALHNGELVLARSFRLHRPRGAFCHNGWCQQCKVRLNDGRVVLACQAPAEELSNWSRPWPFMRLIGLLAERFPPWFHEHRLLWPRALRQTYLHILRGLSGALPLPRGNDTDSSRTSSGRSCQTLVVGGGLSGLAAATELSAAGRDVLLIDADQLGGTARFIPQLTSEVARRKLEFQKAGGRTLENALCIGLYDDVTTALCATGNGTISIAFEELVIATGAYDRSLPVRGNDLPGVIGVRAFERLAHLKAIPKASKIGVHGDLIATTRVRAAAEAAGYSLAWALTPAADTNAGLTGATNTLTAIEGRSRISGARFADNRFLACDILVIGFSQPTYELQVQAGKTIRFDEANRPFRTEGITQTPLLIVGEAAGVSGPLAASQDGEEAARAWISGQAFDRHPSPAAVEPVSRPDDAAMLCACEDVRVKDVRSAIADGFDNVELVKRRTGAGTGPCQGKLCHHNLLSCLAEANLPTVLPTMRPLIRPVKLSTFAGAAADD